MAFLAAQEEEEENLPPITDDTFFENAKSSSIKISLKAQMGDIKTPTFCVRFDHNDKYIAAARGDGSISIFNVLTHKQSYVLNEGMEEPMPTTIVRWRPICAPGVTKNVLIATNAKGHISHYHTTSGKLLNRIYDEVNQLLTCDYKPDGYDFVTAGTDTVVRVYDE
jgi:COMPASS component SWD3